ncbi:MAG TPA: DUF3817 domain-containing protein [Flavobacteriaceae bacterium]|nr:DUF3817 domain-containing protein [Flavobacteriaceae bacterium]MCB9213206.1 DUF3817 domain-containing protein [Alteromonas sp.]HPF10122.1 DUF3817 domain-containing protein [Flavobacteriaceae bacterium]HQU22243.1 DUF3817 domain-containing protein [Flavobacteriaceae bacterium]HQU66124.1 DUF3817 domain-containing protein [Flavobacteriaceae bacterium]
MEITAQQFRFVSILEGLSFLILLGIAMPLKYVWGLPQMVQFVGMTHGILFMLYVGGAFIMKRRLQWTLAVFAMVLFCSILPFGPFYVERKYL